MKVLLLLTLCLFSSAKASTVDGFSIPLLGLNQQENFSLNSIQTRTEYRYETVQRTCTRTELDGYQNVCSTVTEIVCERPSEPRRPGGRFPYPGRRHDHLVSSEICRPTPVYRCRQEPVYRTVSYACNQTITIPYEVFDHEVRANIRLSVNAQASSVNSSDPNCSLKYTLEGDSLRSSADCSSLLVYSNSKRRSEVDRSGNVTLTQNDELTLIDTKTHLAPVAEGIEEMSLDGQVLSFRTGDLNKNPKFALNLFIERKRFFKSDKVIINRTLSRNEFSFEKINEKEGIVRVDLDKLVGGINADKKHDIKVELNVSLPAGNIINTVLPVTKANGHLRVNN